MTHPLEIRFACRCSSGIGRYYIVRSGIADKTEFASSRSLVEAEASLAELDKQANPVDYARNSLYPHTDSYGLHFTLYNDNDPELGFLMFDYQSKYQCVGEK
jgi:hypothetical protein